MKYLFLFLLFSFVVCSCKKDGAEMELLHKKLDSIAQQLETLKREKKVVKLDSLEEKEAIRLTKKSKILIKNDSITKKEIIKPKKTITKDRKLILKKESPKSIILANNDTVFHYYKNERISVKVAPRSDRQSIWIYAPNGKITYKLENTRLSYSCYNELIFRADGSLEHVKSSMNPGASMYMYKTFTYFDERNEPRYKIDEKTPASVEDYMNNKSLWDSNNRRWIKQEIIKETNSPPK
jgi:hypothetical protein